MDIEKFVSSFAAQFEETDINEFSANKNFRELNEWSSFAALTIIAMVDDEYVVKITGEDIRSSQTIEEIFKIVQSRV